MMDFDIGLGLIVSRRLLGPDSGMVLSANRVVSEVYFSDCAISYTKKLNSLA